MTRCCEACGHGELRDTAEPIAIALPSAGVIARVLTPARRCARCGEVRMDGAVLSRAHLSVGCELADHGVRTGDALRHMRRALGLRAADLARLLDVTPETVSHWETGKALLTRAVFVAVAAMVEEAAEGRTTTRDRLDVLAAGRSYPRALTVKLRAGAARRRGSPRVRDR